MGVRRLSLYLPLRLPPEVVGGVFTGPRAVAGVGTRPSGPPQWPQRPAAANAGSRSPGLFATREVKTRRMRHGWPEALDSVGPRKRLRVRRMAGSWLSERGDRPFAAALRFDAIGITFDAAGRLLSLDHVEDAF